MRSPLMLVSRTPLENPCLLACSKWSEGAHALEAIGCVVLTVDVTKQEMIDAALKEVEDQLKEKKLALYGLVNNAGINVTGGPMEWNSPEMVEKQLNVNTMGVVRVTRSFLPLIRAAKGICLTAFVPDMSVSFMRLMVYGFMQDASSMFAVWLPTLWDPK